jgi:hypothetical protein
LKSKSKYFQYLSYLLSILVFLPIVANNLPPIIGSYHLYAAIWIASLLLFEPKVFSQKIVLYFLGFSLFFTIIFPLIIWTNITRWNLNAIKVEFYDMVIPITVLGYFQYKNDYKSLAIFVKLSIFFIIITGIMTLYSASINPLYARMIGNWFDPETNKYFDKFGGGKYGYVGALIGIFPILIFYIRNSNLIDYSRGILIGLVAFLFFVVLTMQFFGNILISAIFIGLSLISVKKIKQTAILLTFIFIVLTWIPANYYGNVLNSTANLFEVDSENYQKLTDMALYIEFGEDTNNKRGDTQNRAARYPDLFATFIQNPFLGSASNSFSSYDQAGAHLHWMNRLTVFGLLGLFMTFYFHRYYIMKIIIQFKEPYKIHFLLASIAILSYGLLKTIAGREVWYMYFLIIPGSYYLPLIKPKKYFIKDKSL